MLYETLEKELVRRGDLPNKERRSPMLFDEKEVKQDENLVEVVESATKAALNEPNVDIAPPKKEKKEKVVIKEEKKASKYFVNTAFLVNVRKDPDPESEIIGNYANGDEISVDENFTNDKYYRTVNSKGYPGYILKTLVKKV